MTGILMVIVLAALVSGALAATVAVLGAIAALIEVLPARAAADDADEYRGRQRDGIAARLSRGHNS